MFLFSAIKLYHHVHVFNQWLKLGASAIYLAAKAIFLTLHASEYILIKPLLSLLCFRPHFLLLM